jgi:tetratricopeptide (TPR) repeat protein
MGRYNDAAAVLKPFVARYPNILQGHLLLAIDYSEMGRDELARAEVQEVLRIDPEFSLEVMKGRLALKDQDQKRRERHLADLRKAGLK